MDRFSQYQSQTKVSNKGFEELEKISGLKLDNARRRAIVAALNRYEFFRKYENDGTGQKRWKAFAAIEDRLRSVIKAAKAEEELPGHLWSLVTGRAGINSEVELKRLQRVCDQFQKLKREIEHGRKKENDPWLSSLLFDLEEQFILAGGTRTGVARGGNKRRGGRFVRFCDAALGNLPKWPNKSIGARWETLFNRRKKGIKPAWHIWVGKAHPGLAHY